MPSQPGVLCRYASCLEIGIMSRTLELESLCAELFNPGERSLSPDGATWLVTLPVGGLTHLFTMPVEGGYPRQITSGLKGFSHPSWSPDGKRLCADSRGGVYIMDSDGGNARELTRHPAGDSWATWFPDGRRIMFGSRRQGWTQAYALPADEDQPAQCITPLPLEFKNARISPDGTRVAAYAQSREDVRRVEVWVFAVDGKAAPVCVTPPGDYREHMHEWCSDSRTLLLLSEGPGDDWVRVWRVEVSDPHRKRTPLTSGPREDGRPIVSKDGARFAFTRNADGVSELWTGDARSGVCAAIDTPAGVIEPLTFSADNRVLYVNRNSPTDIPHLARIDLATGRLTALTHTQPPGHSAEDFITPERIHFNTRAGFTVGAYLWTPRTVAAGEVKKAPLILHAHGGPPVQTRFRWDAGFQWLAAQGYGVLDFDYRGSCGYGRTFRRALYGHWGSADVEDTLDAVAWARDHVSWADQERLAIRGSSYGGYMVLLALTQHPSLFRCGLNACGVTEVSELARTCNASERIATILQMGDPDSNQEAYRRASPVYRVENIQAPLLVNHGRQDVTVTLAQSELLIQQMKIHGKFVDFKYYDGEGHSLSRPETRVDCLQRETAFLKAHLT